MTAICFVCNLPILSHQVGLVWQGGNGWDDMMREQMEESTLKARLGQRRDSSAQITTVSPPTETQETSPPPRRDKRRRSSLAQFTDIFKEWSASASRKRKQPLTRRETLADLVNSLPWSRSDATRKQIRESSIDYGVAGIGVKSPLQMPSLSKSTTNKRDGQQSQSQQYSGARAEVYQLLMSGRRRSSVTYPAEGERRDSLPRNNRAGDSADGEPSRRDSLQSPKTRRHPRPHNRTRRTSQQGSITRHTGKYPTRRESKTDVRVDNRRSSVSSEPLDVDTSIQLPASVMKTDSSTQALPPPTIITSTVTPPSTSPGVSPQVHVPPSVLPLPLPPPLPSSSPPQSSPPLEPTSSLPLTSPSIPSIDASPSNESILPQSVSAQSQANVCSIVTMVTASGTVTVVTSAVASSSVTGSGAVGEIATTSTMTPIPASTIPSPTHPSVTTRRDSATQLQVFPPKVTRALQRQQNAIDDGGVTQSSGRSLQPLLSTDKTSGLGAAAVDTFTRKTRRDSLSPDSARSSRRGSQTHLSPERSGKRETSPIRRSTTSTASSKYQHQRCKHGLAHLRRRSSQQQQQPPQSQPQPSPPPPPPLSPTSSPPPPPSTPPPLPSSQPPPLSSDSCSSCSSRDQSPSRQPTGAATTTVMVASPTAYTRTPAIRRQSTTEEILIARGFRRQSTTEEMIRCRNFRRQSSQSEDCCRYRGRRDSSAQITDGTLATMVVETGSTFFDSGTQTDPSPLYDNNHYHEECLRCNSCGLNLTGVNQKRARRFKNQILCDLHFADVALMECSDFMQQLRSFKPQSLGCVVARRKSSTTLIFPLPPQACSDEFCKEYPHNLMPTPGYWIECSRQKITNDPYSSFIWGDESDNEADGEDTEDEGAATIQDGTIPSTSGISTMPPRPRYPRDDSLLLEDDEYLDEEGEDGGEFYPPPRYRKKTTIEEQWDKNQAFELTSVEQETYERYFYGSEHWNYFTSDEDLGPVILSLKQESINGRDQFRILVRAVSYTVHGLIPASCVFADRYNREEVVRSLGKEINLNPPLVLGQLPDTPDELLKLDQVFIKSELKVGVIYVKEKQYTEEDILDNNENSYLFTEFLNILGDTVVLKGFEKYRGGLDTVHDLTGEYSVYTNWRNIEIMFHVSTFLPYEKHDPQKLQRKRHIGNDIVCVVFLEADNTLFLPASIKSHFLHTFIVVRTSPRVRRKTTRYEVSVVTRDEVGAYKPYLWEQSVFENGPMFREWILTKIVNGERASYSAPKFARMQERTRSQMLEDLVANLQNHAETGQIPKPYRRGSWRPIGHMRPSSPLLDSVRDRFEDYDQLAKDFTKNFLNNDDNVAANSLLFDVVFLVGQSKQRTKFLGVRAILGVRSRVFQEMLYGISAGFGSPQIPVAELLSRVLPSIPTSSAQKPKSSNFLQVPDIESTRSKSVPSSPIVRRAFTKLGTITAGWGRSFRGKPPLQLTLEDKKKWSSSHDCSNKETKEKEKAVAEATRLAVPRLSVCADAQKIDKTKLAQTEFSIMEFDAETFRILLDYLHTSSCPITCATVPGLICAAEHYDLPELLQACFHHTKQFLRLEVICLMLNNLENYVWRYNSAVELVNLIFLYIEQNALKVFLHPDFLTLSESMVNQIMNRNLDVPEIRKFEAMIRWAENESRTKPDPQQEFKHIMDRLKKEIDLLKIAPQDLIRIVLPSKTIENKDILNTLTQQANSGVYRHHESTLEEFRQQVKLEKLQSTD